MLGADYLYSYRWWGISVVLLTSLVTVVGTTYGNLGWIRWQSDCSKSFEHTYITSCWEIFFLYDIY